MIIYINIIFIIKNNYCYKFKLNIKHSADCSVASVCQLIDTKQYYNEISNKMTETNKKQQMFVY
jgi:hypothetical protein